MTEYAVVLITASSQEEAQKKARTMVEERLFALANNVLPFQPMAYKFFPSPPQAGPPLLIILSSNTSGLRLYPIEIILRALRDGQKQHLRYLIAMEFLDTSDY